MSIKGLGEPMMQPVDSGSNTGGWQRRSVELGLGGANPADGVYRGTLVYVLS